MMGILAATLTNWQHNNRCGKNIFSWIYGGKK